MPRTARVQPGGLVFHVLNRGNNRQALFDHDGDFDAFVQVMAEAMTHVPIDLLAYCLMPNHWHLVLRPRATGDLGRFMQRLTVTHVRRWRAHRQSVGQGHVYQGPYKSFAVQKDGHFLMLCRYVERNPLRAGLVPRGRAQAWRWCSLWQRLQTTLPGEPGDWPDLAPWPVPMPRNWTDRVNRPETAAELERVRLSIARNHPLGTATWTAATARRLGLPPTLRPRGRPPKAKK